MLLSRFLFLSDDIEVMQYRCISAMVVLNEDGHGTNTIALCRRKLESGSFSFHGKLNSGIRIFSVLELQIRHINEYFHSLRCALLDLSVEDDGSRLHSLLKRENYQ
mmetsp:Transcript_6972/g.10990  ORF Transcript_6972/g.10990 Transcript_6972/m.10990 type:complete len:106 (+) Transcript_6972:187-504(+)